MALKLFTMAQVNVAAAGTRVQVSANDLYASTVIFQAAEGNGGLIYVGDVNVSSTRYAACLGTGEIFSISADNGGVSSGQEFNLKDLYVDTSNAGDDVYVSYVKRR